MTELTSLNQAGISTDDLETEVKDILRRLPSVLAADELIYLQMQFNMAVERDPLRSDADIRRDIFSRWLEAMRM